MNKSELIDAIAKDAKITKVEAGKVLDATTTAITKALKKGDRVAQIAFYPLINMETSFTDAVTNTDRGNKGTGSSGK